jgi:hypothetical protein
LVDESQKGIMPPLQSRPIVDADHKNYLAQLTVVQKLNQGVRQWLCIIAGLFFSRRSLRSVGTGLLLSFAEAKERRDKMIKFSSFTATSPA